MFEISKNGIITVNRGDNFTIRTEINEGSVLVPEYYFLNEGDKLYFALMEPKQPFEFAVVRKVFTAEDQDSTGAIFMDFKPEDTEFLVPGKYYYSIKLQKFLGLDEDEQAITEVSTVRSKTQFIIID